MAEKQNNSLLIKAFSQSTLFCAILKKIWKSNQHPLFLAHPKFYSLEASGFRAIFRTINQTPWKDRLLVPGQFSRWFFFSLGAPKYKSEVKWEPEVLPIGCPPLSASQVLPCTLRAPRSNWKTTDVGQVLHFADEKTEAHGMKCLAQNAPIFADGTKRTTQVS